MTRKTTSLLAAATLAFSGTAMAESPSDAAHQAHMTYLAAINSNDTARLLDAVTDDIVLIAPNAPPLVGKDAVAPWVAGYFDAVETTWKKQTLEFVVGDGWAFERYSYSVVDRPRDGAPASTDTGNGINIYRLDPDGVWRVARDAWATDRPMPLTYEGMGPF